MAKGGDGGFRWEPLVPRFILGVVFIYHGGQKLFGLFGGPPDGMARLAEAIRSWGWPLPDVMARAAGVTEFFGGACLLLGLLTRFWAAGLAFTMFVAYWKVHGPKGFGLQDGGWEYNFVLGTLALALVVQGGGTLSLDRMFFSRGARKPQPGRE